MVAKFSTSRFPVNMFVGMGASLKRVLAIRSPTLNESLSVEMLTSSYLPYEASRTYREIMVEYESRHTQNLVEVKHCLMRGI